jgi:tetratricopeptide (TPR) repeat protein
MLGAALGLLLLAAAHDGALTAPHAASARPAPCLPEQPDASNDESRRSPSRPGPWETVRQGALADFCKELARAQVQLLGRPELALASARSLARAWPGRPEPWVLEARAHTRLNAYAQAWPAWQAARERGHDFRSPHVLRDFAIAAAMSGKADVALESYRRLVTLVSLWPEPRERHRVYLEAASAALRGGAAGTDEAAGYLASVRAETTSTGLRAYVAGMDALVAHRRGQPASKIERLEAGEIWHFVARARDEQRPKHWPVVSRHEAQGAASLLVEKLSASEATELWALYVKGLEQAAVDPASMTRARERLSRLQAQGERLP